MRGSPSSPRLLRSTVFRKSAGRPVAAVIRRRDSNQLHPHRPLEKIVGSAANAPPIPVASPFPRLAALDSRAHGIFPLPHPLMLLSMALAPLSLSYSNFMPIASKRCTRPDISRRSLTRIARGGLSLRKKSKFSILALFGYLLGIGLIVYACLDVGKQLKLFINPAFAVHDPGYHICRDDRVVSGCSSCKLLPKVVAKAFAPSRSMTPTRTSKPSCALNE